MEQEYYREYYHLERNHWWFRAREKILTAYISKLIKEKHLDNHRLKILNVGCGPGRSSENLARFGSVISVEYDKLCCEFAARTTELEIINASITNLPFNDRSFDLVCAFDVIEHVDDEKAAVAEMKRVTANNGIIFITVPAFQSLWSHHDEINHHYRRYKLNQLKRLFETSGGKLVYATYFNFFLFFPIFLFRQGSNILKTGKKRAGSGSDFEAFNPGILNSILYRLMSFEAHFVSSGIKLPLGVSIMYSWKKADKHGKS